MRRSLPSTQALACFEAAARHESYTRAAQELALTQSAVSRQITTLEEFLGVPLFRLPSGAGHDAMKLHEVMPQAMLFVRGQNGGISHNPLESTTSDDMQLALEAFQRLLEHLAADMT